MQNNPKTVPASTVETVDTGLYEWVDKYLNLHTRTNKGLVKTPILWLGTERVYQIKSDQRIRDAAGKLILPLVTINRSSMTKDPSFKGSFQAHLPGNSAGSSTRWKQDFSQEINSKFQTTEHYKKSKGNQTGKPEDADGKVYNHHNTQMPVYLTMMYDVTIRTEYQQQMNDLLQPFVTTTGQINSFIFSKDGHRYEAFIQQDFGQNDTVTSLAENPRIFETKITIKVLGYLVGEGINNPKPKLSRKENRARIRFTRERTMVGDKIPWKDKDNDYRD
jgi:hypothetical protein